MKIFITGATGFIGTHLVRRLIQTKHKLYCLVRETSDVRTLDELGVTLVRGDVTDIESLHRGMKDCEGVIHLANIYTFWESDKGIYRKVNVDGTRNVIECAQEIGTRKFVHVSTALVYGKPTDCPFTEESQVGPKRFSEYARTKYEGDQIAWDFYKKKGLPLVALYPGAVLGMGDDKPSGKFIKAYVRGRVKSAAFANSAMTYVHVRDVSEAILRALEQEGTVGEKYLLGNQTLTSREYYAMLSDISGVPLPTFYSDAVVLGFIGLVNWRFRITKKRPPTGLCWDEVRTTQKGLVFDGSKAERKLGIAYTPIRSALEELIASYKT